jgi:hypothetical protein
MDTVKTDPNGNPHVDIEEVTVTASAPKSSNSSSYDWSSEYVRYGFNGTYKQWMDTYSESYGLNGDWNQWYSLYGQSWSDHVDKLDKEEAERRALLKMCWFVTGTELLSYVIGPESAISTYKSLASPNISSAGLSFKGRGVGFKTYNTTTSVKNGTGHPPNAKIKYTVNAGKKTKSIYFTNEKGEVIYQIDNWHANHPKWHGHKMSIPGDIGSGHRDWIDPYFVPLKFK